MEPIIALEYGGPLFTRVRPQRKALAAEVICPLT